MKAENQVKAKNIIVVACAIFAVLLLVALIISLVSLASASNRKARLERELATVTAMVERNRAALDYFSSDEYIEWVAREYLDMQGEGEIGFTGK